MRTNFQDAMMGVAGVCVGLLMAGQAWAVPISVFSENFDGGGASAEFSGVTTVVPVQGYAGVGAFSGSFLRNTTGGNVGLSILPGSPTTLTLMGLPVHHSVDLNFLLAVIDSWDGFDGNGSPDIFNVTVDGATVFSRTFSNSEGLGSQGFDRTNATGARQSYGTGLGFTPEQFFNDAAYDMSGLSAFNAIPHTASTLTVEWFASGAGWQGGTDESWAIDNVEVIVNTIVDPGIPNNYHAAPEPITAALGLMGLGVLGMATRRRVA